MKNMAQAKAHAMEALEKAFEAAEAMTEFAHDDKWSLTEHATCFDAANDLRKIKERLQSVTARPNNQENNHGKS